MTPTTYAVQIRGHLDDHWSDWLAGLALTRNDDGTTTLTGSIQDQAQLFGVLSGLRDLNAPLLSVDVVPDRPPTLATELHTARLILRPASAADADSTWAFRQLGSINEWLTGCPETLDEYRVFFAQPERLATTVVVEHDGNVIGDFMLRQEDAWAQTEKVEQARGALVELGWVLDPGHEGQGFATEAVLELIRHSFLVLGARRVVATCFADNTGSWRLMERVGMRREAHHVRDALHRSGAWLDSYTYAILNDEAAARD